MYKISLEFLLQTEGALEIKKSLQYFDIEFNQFLADRFIKGTCPNCGNTEAHGDQCEGCGQSLSPTDLINPISTLSNSTPILKETEHFYFNVKLYEQQLIEWLTKCEQSDNWKNYTLQQSFAFLKVLQSRPITRDLKFGVSVPVEGYEDKVFYVWFDAPLGYLSITLEALKSYWKQDSFLNSTVNDSVEFINFIGKDNVYFHTVFFPALLMAHNSDNNFSDILFEFPLPTNVVTNHFLTIGGDKFSKSKMSSLEQVVDNYLSKFEGFKNKEDALRFTIARKLPENQDANFSLDDLMTHYDNELVNSFGNLINRTVTLVNNYFDGNILTFNICKIISPLNHNESISSDEVYEYLKNKTSEVVSHINKFEIKKALEVIMDISDYGNKLLQYNEPWKFHKENPNDIRISSVLYASCEILNVLSVLLNPYIPFATAHLREMLNLPQLENGELSKLIETQDLGEDLFTSNVKIQKPKILFEKIFSYHNKT